MKRVDTGNDWRQEYEILRQGALDVEARRGHGLALFLSRGMMAWLDTLAALRPRQPLPHGELDRSADLPSVLQPDLTTLLADMVLSCMGKGDHEFAVESYR
jgi:hypothetical protein